MCGPSKTDCVCRNDYIPTVNKYLSSCVKSRCTLGDYRIDLSSASNLYNGYCTSMGYFAVTVNGDTTAVATSLGATATVNSDTTAMATSLNATATVTVYVSKNLAPGGIRYLDFRFPLAGLVSHISFSTRLI